MTDHGSPWFTPSSTLAAITQFQPIDARCFAAVHQELAALAEIADIDGARPDPVPPSTFSNRYDRGSLRTLIDVVRLHLGRIAAISLCRHLLLLLRRLLLRRFYLQQQTQGAGAKTAVKGAATGAVIGEVASNDADQGAKYGAAAGAVAGRRRTKQAQAQTQQQGQQQVQQAQALSKEQTDAFRKAFSACLEAKKYVVKY